MAIDPKKWTTKTNEAIGAAGDLARQYGNPEVTPDHVMVALTSQEDTIIPSLLQKLGIAAGMLRTKAEEAVHSLPRATIMASANL